MPNILVNNNFYQGTSSACIVDTTPPTFAGINFLDVESRGQIRAGWAAATDPTLPIRYEVYIQANSAINLFNTNNIIALTDKLQYDIFTLPDGSFLVNGTTYYVGVRAIDGVNNRDNNTVSQSVISTGVLTAIDTYKVEGSFSININNEFELTAWANKNDSLANAPDAVMGAASYQIYDSSGNPVTGMSGSVSSPNTQGLYIFNPTSSTLNLYNTNYTIQITISVDGEDRVNYVSILPDQDTININGIADINDSNQITGSFWAQENFEILTGSQLGLGSYVTYTASGTLIPGLSENNISPDANGFYTISPLSLGGIDTTKAYIVEISILISGELRTSRIILGNEPAVYENKAIFSINASNQLEATFWATKNNELVPQLLLGTASYTVYDKNGVAVAGLTESGLVADANGKFHITPVSAALLTDLTHYTVLITITIAGKAHTNSKGFTLLGN